MYNHTSNTILEEFKDENQLKAELEDVDSNIKKTYEIFIKYIGEDGLRKLFSRNILYKDEGLDTINKTIPSIFQNPDSSEINKLINLLMKMLYSFLSEKHPQVSIRSIEIFETLLKEIKKSTAALNYDMNVTDRILLKINEKVGDVNPKLRNRAVELYGFMLKQDFCDYNNLVTELVEDELKYKIPRSSKMIIGKLSILENVFRDFNSAVSEKRTDMNSFPFLPIATYVSEKISHNRSEVRKLGRNVLIAMYVLFGYKKLEPLLKKVEERELEKLVGDIPELREFLNNQKESKKPRGRSNSREKEGKDGNSSFNGGSNSNSNKNKKKEKSPSVLICRHCNKSDKTFLTQADIEKHIEKDCLCFVKCVKCKNNIEVKTYNYHLLNECANKDEFKMCKRCKESIDVNEYEVHVKENKCNPAKNSNSSNRCPLCHKDIPPQDKGFVQHLVRDICQKHKRREKIGFVNGK